MTYNTVAENSGQTLLMSDYHQPRGGEEYCAFAFIQTRVILNALHSVVWSLRLFDTGNARMITNVPVVSPSPDIADPKRTDAFLPDSAIDESKFGRHLKCGRVYLRTTRDLEISVLWRT